MVVARKLDGMKRATEHKRGVVAVLAVSSKTLRWIFNTKSVDGVVLDREVRKPGGQLG